MIDPLDEIKNPFKFQQIVAEYFRLLKSEKLDFHISDIQVEDNGVGTDDGCDILVDFYFEDAIGRHSHRWIIECKSQKRAVSLKDINGSSLEVILRSNKANGYLLICRNDATAQLKRLFKNNKTNGNYDYIVWNGTQLWHKISKNLKFIETFFPKYYHENYVQNKAKAEFENLVETFSNELINKKK